MTIKELKPQPLMEVPQGDTQSPWLEIKPEYLPGMYAALEKDARDEEWFSYLHLGQAMKILKLPIDGWKAQEEKIRRHINNQVSADDLMGFYISSFREMGADVSDLKEKFGEGICDRFDMRLANPEAHEVDPYPGIASRAVPLQELGFSVPNLSI